MKTLNASILVLAILGSTPAWADQSEISPKGSRPTVIAPSANFTGAALVEPTDKTSMRHIAISGMVNGKNVDWLEKVTDEPYQAK
jgi:hypothetical protein